MTESIWTPIIEQFSGGDPKFLELMIEQIELYNAKNKDYASDEEGEAFDPNGNFNRVSTILALYPGLSLSDPRVFALALLMKQFDQVLWSMSRGFEGEIEGLDAKLQDIVVYFMIIRCLNWHLTNQKADEIPDILIPSVFLPYKDDVTISFQCATCHCNPCCCKLCMTCQQTVCTCFAGIPDRWNTSTVKDETEYHLTGNRD